MPGGRGRRDARRGPGVTGDTPRVSAAGIVAGGGLGERTGGGLPKQFRPIAGTPMILRAARPLIEAGCRPVVVAVPDAHLDLAADMFAPHPEVVLVPGGTTRGSSVAAALRQVETDHVLVHDAARPFADSSLAARVLHALVDAEAVIPVIPAEDTLKRVEDGRVAETIDRSGVWRVQTPQGFRTSLLRRAHSDAGSVARATDDAMLVELLGTDVRIVPGSRLNLKVTYEEDLEMANKLAQGTGPASALRIGHGADIHAFVEGRPLMLGGVEVPHPKGLVGHSDADVLSHSIADAILGAARLGDLGAKFPADDRWSGASSLEILAETTSAARAAGWEVVNVDATVIAAEPKLAPFKEQMTQRIAAAMGIDVTAVSVKATTTDGLGAIGRAEGIAAQAVVLLRAT